MPSDSINIAEIRSRAMSFALRWQGTTYERGESQTFWNEFLAVFGVDRKRVAFFEQRAKKMTGSGFGFIDLFWPGVLLVEQKSAGKNLDLAESQADEYLASLTNAEFPIARVVSDFERLKVTWYEGTDKGNTSIVDLKDLPIMVDKFAFLAGYKVRDYSQMDHERVNGRAVSLLVGLYKEIGSDHYSEEVTATFLNRVLFLLFGDDSGLWSRGLFYQLISESAENGSDLSWKLTELFKNLDKPVDVRSPKLDPTVSQFPYVNGQIFRESSEVPVFDNRMRSALLECSLFDWAQVSPDIFGSLFQEVKALEDRRVDGEHYTSPENILKVLDSLFLVDLKVQFQKCGSSLVKLEAFRSKLGEMHFLDPACGCGNFLVVAYREMRKLELEVLKKIRSLHGQTVLATMDMTDSLNVTLDHFHGIELHDWPSKITRTAMFLTDHQANVELSENFGVAPSRLPIIHSADIRTGNALQMDWIEPAWGTDITILGNPPFAGMDKMTEAQQEDRNMTFTAIGFSAGHRAGRLDYVSSWFAKAISCMSGNNIKAAFVTTNSLFQGDQARAMETVFLESGVVINFAHRTFKWSSGGRGKAAVFCSIIGFSKSPGYGDRKIFEYPDSSSNPYERHAKTISAYLIDCDLQGPVKLTRPINPSLPPLRKGSQPTDDGHLIVEAEDYLAVAEDPICKKYLKPFIRAKALLNGGEAWCLWLVAAQPAELRGSPILQERLAAVASFRAKSKTPSVRKKAETPYLFTQIRQPVSNWLAVPRVSSENRSYIPMAYLTSDSIAGDTLSFVESADPWLFAALQTKAFTDWVATFSGAMKGDFRISPDLSFNSFPLLAIQDKHKAKMAALGGAILDMRNKYPNETLADLYHDLSMPADLRKAHTELDSYVDKILKLSEPTRVERARALLEMHHQLLGYSELLGE